MALYRKKPVVIEAFKFVVDRNNNPEKWGPVLREPGYNKPFYIRTLEGNHVVTPGDYIITGVKGEHYPCKPDIFALTYEEVAEETSDPEGAEPDAA